MDKLKIVHAARQATVDLQYQREDALTFSWEGFDRLLTCIQDLRIHLINKARTELKWIARS